MVPSLLTSMNCRWFLSCFSRTWICCFNSATSNNCVARFWLLCSCSSSSTSKTFIWDRKLEWSFSAWHWSSNFSFAKNSTSFSRPGQEHKNNNKIVSAGYKNQIEFKMRLNSGTLDSIKTKEKNLLRWSVSDTKWNVILGCALCLWKPSLLRLLYNVVRRTWASVLNPKVNPGWRYSEHIESFHLHPWRPHSSRKPHLTWPGVLQIPFLGPFPLNPSSTLLLPQRLFPNHTRSSILQIHSTPDVLHP